MKTYRMWVLAIFFLAAGSWKADTFAQSVKGQNMRMHSIPLSKNPGSQSEKVEVPAIGFISLLPYEKSGAKVKSAFDFLKGKNPNAEYITFNQVAKQQKVLNKFKILWIHKPDSVKLTEIESGQKFINAIRSYLQNGGNLLLTQQAFHYLNVLGLEPVVPVDSTKPCVDEGYGRKLGFHAFREHPLFSGMHGGGYVQRPSRDLTTRITGYFGNKVPKNGKVIAVDWDYIILKEGSKLVLEYTLGKGRLIAVGGYMDFAEPNLNRAHLEMFTQNIFDFLQGKFIGQPAYYWTYEAGSVNTCDNLKPETDQLLIAVPESKPWATTKDDLTLENRFATKNFWDVAGERLVTMGSENGGIEEVWSHPFMAFRDYEVGIRFSYRDTIYWLSDERPEIAADPAYFMRQYKFPRAYLKEVIVNDPVNPTGVIHYEYRGVYGAELVLQFKSNLRWMWPYSSMATGAVCHSWDADLNAFNIRDKSNDLNVFIGANRRPLDHQSGQFDGFSFDKGSNKISGKPTDMMQAGFLLTYALGMNDQLDIVYTASVEGYATTYKQFDLALHDPKLIYEEAVNNSRKFLASSLLITTPDNNFNLGYRWALTGTNRFLVNTPGMGTALVAGYASTRHGWDGGQKVSGRPGYSWYFGRDGQWSSFALLDYGDFDKVKQELEFFNKYQDLTGKIFHEATTSGFIHYDAADATPLYVVLAGKYFRHTNDTAFIRKSWPHIRKAIDFCFSTDTDGDHLIENTNVGHGWVEGGELYGSHATIYMTGIWAAALREAANMAAFTGDREAESYGLESKELKDIINKEFWNKTNQFFAYGKNRNGTFRTEATVLPAVPLYFKTADPEKAKECLKQFAGNSFSTNWGTRIVRDDSPYFKPTGYHYGSVWPLFTGWTALAEYAYGNYPQGFSHLMNNLNIYRNWGLGFVEEVMNGAEYKPSGVCAHQCWSETMVLQPAIEGMLGIDIRAQENKVILSPRLPADWDTLDVRNIRMEDKRLGFNFHRKGGNYTYDFLLSGGSGIELEFLAVLPAGAFVQRVTIDNAEIPFTIFKSEQNVTVLIKTRISKFHRIAFDTDKGIAVLPVIADPKPGYPSAGTRIISARLRGKEYTVEMEGVPGSIGKLEIYINGQQIIRVEGGEIRGQHNQITQIEVLFENGTMKYATKSVKIVLE